MLIEIIPVVLRHNSCIIKFIFRLPPHKCFVNLSSSRFQVTATKFLRGHFDVCFGIEQNHIYPCHAGCLLNMQMKRESDEVGEIDLGQVDSLWQRAVSNGLENKVLSIE